MSNSIRSPLDPSELPPDFILSPAEVERQWSLLAGGAERISLNRPCTIDDGIEAIPAGEHATLIAAQRESAARGRWLKFVPASGAASRMFVLRSEERKRRFVTSLDRFAFAGAVRRHFNARGVEFDALVAQQRYDELIKEIVGPDGLDYGRLPKGLLQFHAYPEGTRTAFEEHLREASACFLAADGALQAHFTVAEESREQFARQLADFQAANPGTSCQVTFSVQRPSTDTIGMNAAGRLFRDPAGGVVLRPGGHGALLENLNEVRGDLLFVKNIDNVMHEDSRQASLAWMQILGGYLVRLQDAVHQHLRSLRAGDDGAVAAAFDFVQLTFPNAALPTREDADRMREALIARLQRPLRVCGMVRNEGEPGGGPFWVREADGGLSLQIVESAEVNSKDDQQQAIFQQATHFNPVFMALAVRDETGAPYDLPKFVDGDRAIVTQKNVAGQDATVLERPGLWNGAMAKWNSVFVEVPIDVFSPVKTVLDLLRPAHQPGA